MKVLNGSEIAGFIKERQLHQSRSLRQSAGVTPRLAIVRTNDSLVTETYLSLKKAYGEDIEVVVDVYTTTTDELFDLIKRLNNDKKVNGVIIQLPLADQAQTDLALKLVAPEKDVDGLGGVSSFTPATAMAINWLLSGYNIELSGKKIAIVGKGRLVGAPLSKMWQDSGYDVMVCDSQTTDLGAVLRQADVIVSAAGVPGLVTGDMVSQGTVVVDAGTASENGKIVGDVAEDVRLRDDVIITPIKGGVGPLTVAALFDNVLTAARSSCHK